jgi:molecular chaperone GrpE
VPEDEAVKNYQKGFELIFEQFMKVLDEEEVKVIETVGLEFDPNIHQAVMQDSNPDFESGHVTAELQKGYILKDRVLRASMVKVNE